MNVNPSKRYRIAVVPGDGIGPEIMREGLKVLRAALGRCGIDRMSFTEVQAGAELYRDTGVDFPEESRKICFSADAVYLAATGLPDVRYPDGTGVSIAWNLRKELDLYAGVRPIILYHSRLSPLKDREAGSIRFTIVRENSEGIYASRWGGTCLHDVVAVNPIIITRKASERIMKVAFDLARESRGAPADGKRRITCADKSNVLGCWAFFRKIFDETGESYPEIERDYSFIDAMGLQLVRKPDRYDVIVAENQHGDILSDLGAALVGGLGFAPSANIGDGKAMFEPAHGTAPDIAGRNLANPAAAILSGAMMFRWLSVRHGDDPLAAAAERIETAVAQVLKRGDVLTADAGGTAACDRMGDAVARAVSDLPSAG